MGQAIGQSLTFGVGVALSPFSIIAVILMLVTARARVNGPVFVVGWLFGRAVVGAIVHCQAVVTSVGLGKAQVISHRHRGEGSSRGARED